MLTTVAIFFLPFASSGAQISNSSAANLVLRYLSHIDQSKSFSSSSGRGSDYVFIGTSRTHFGGWRAISIAGDTVPRIVWDSFTLHDSYLSVIGRNGINAEATENGSYIITIRGCAPHQCSDGRIGFALYASQTHKTYIAHMTTQDDGAYRVTYAPRAGIPDAYRDELNQMICKDNGISQPSTLPLSCNH
jgi:hypothetical protein